MHKPEYIGKSPDGKNYYFLELVNDYINFVLYNS